MIKHRIPICVVLVGILSGCSVLPAQHASPATVLSLESFLVKPLPQDEEAFLVSVQ